jgi:hypothetical protein
MQNCLVNTKLVSLKQLYLLLPPQNFTQNFVWVEEQNFCGVVVATDYYKNNL